MTCKQAEARRRHEKKQDSQAVAKRVGFKIDGTEIDRVHQFKYLGRILTDDD